MIRGKNGVVLWLFPFWKILKNQREIKSREKKIIFIMNEKKKVNELKEKLHKIDNAIHHSVSFSIAKNQIYFHHHHAYFIIIAKAYRWNGMLFVSFLNNNFFRWCLMNAPITQMMCVLFSSDHGQYGLEQFCVRSHWNWNWKKKKFENLFVVTRQIQNL